LLGGFPDGCRLHEVSRGKINCDGWKVYLSHALDGFTVGLQSIERGYRVWFYSVLLGTFEIGLNETLDPTFAFDAEAADMR